jgi:lipid-binding SYLF domain-containing protein
MVLVAIAAAMLLPASAVAATADEINAEVDRVLEHFRTRVVGGESLLRDARGVLVIPGVVQAGIGIGGEYGEGALRIGGESAEYYSLASASIGLQFGAQKKDVVLLFMKDPALKQFREASGWKAGVDGSVAVVQVGAEGNIETNRLNQPILGFVVGQKGFMANLSLEGSKFTKLVR